MTDFTEHTSISIQTAIGKGENTFKSRIVSPVFPLVYHGILFLHSFLVLLFQFSSVAQLCLTLCNAMDCSMLGFPVHQQLPEFTQTHVHWVGDAIQPSHPLSSLSSLSLNLSQHQGLFKWVSSLHQVTKGLELQLHYQSFQWIFRTDFL